MLRSVFQLNGYTLRATDGDVGTVDDFLFDDRAWAVRYLVADTGKWLPGRRVLLPPVALGRPDWEERVVPVALTRERIESGPDLREDEPVSRQRETELHRYHGWAPYWGVGPEGAAMSAFDLQRGEVAPDTPAGDPHLRSVNEVTGYRIAATDGEIGHVEDFVVEDGNWLFRWLVVDTRNWWPGKKVVVSPAWIREVRWDDRTVRVDLTRERIRGAPEYDPAAPINREYEIALYDFHGRPRYWE